MLLDFFNCGQFEEGLNGFPFIERGSSEGREKLISLTDAYSRKFSLDNLKGFAGNLIGRSYFERSDYLF